MSTVPLSPLERAPGLERALDLPCVLLKRDDQLPTGYHKFRAASTVSRLLAANDVSEVVVASCGSYAIAVLRAVERMDIRVHVFLAPASPATMKAASVAESITVLDSYEHAVAAAGQFAKHRAVIDISPGASLAAVIRGALGSGALEVIQQFGQWPSSIFCPVGNGSTLAGIFETLALATTSQPLPHLFGVGLLPNPLLGGGTTGGDGSDLRLEPLRSSVPLDAAGASAGVLFSNGQFISADLRELEDAQKLLAKHHHANLSLAGAASVAGLIKQRPSLMGRAARSVVCLLTSSGVAQ